MPQLATDVKERHTSAQHDRGGRIAEAVQRDHGARPIIYETSMLAATTSDELPGLW